ncbi:unnamed protein product [Cuscuta campestris]|uniref:Uncharacterized protein n=1 Tax=Cuscuta campestris TaxID=132261 RepID=A0A484K139_9ASTE|nr:unnamed protein product [Cuscuta campestris]
MGDLVCELMKKFPSIVPTIFGAMAKGFRKAGEAPYRIHLKKLGGTKVYKSALLNKVSELYPFMDNPNTVS